MPSVKWPVPQLNSDVIERILEFLDPNRREDRTALRNVALCSRFFVDICQPILFREIHLQDIRGTHASALDEAYIPISKRSERLHRILKKNLKLINLIHQFTITISRYEKGLGNIKAFRELLGFVVGNGAPKFKTLHIKGDATMKDNRTFEKRLLYPFLASRITHLAFDGVKDVPIALIAHCSGLVNLQLHNTRLEPLSAVPSLRPNDVIPSLKDLDISGSYNMLDTLISHPSKTAPFLRLSQVSCLATSITCPSTDIPFFTRICKLNKASLKSLDLSLILVNNRISGLPGMEALSFDACTSVESVNLHIQISLHAIGNCRSRLDDIVAALQTVPADNNLNTFNIHLHIHSAKYEPDFLGDCEAEWVNLDAEMARIIGNGKVAVHLLVKYSTDAYKPATHIMARQIDTIIRDIDRECFVLVKETIYGTFSFLFEMVNEYYSHNSYCRTIIYR